MLRKCRKCGLEALSSESLVLFKYNKSSKHSRENICKLCAASKNAPEAFNITAEEYRALLLNAKCQVCGSKDKLCYDHDHKTGKFRGVLCQNHNRGLGLIGDTREDVLALLRYFDG